MVWENMVCCIIIWDGIETSMNDDVPMCCEAMVVCVVWFIWDVQNECGYF